MTSSGYRFEAASISSASAQIHRHARLTKNVFARFERGNGHRRMHVGRRPDPDDVEIVEGEEVGPVRHRRRLRHIFATKFFRAFVGGIRNGDDLHFRMPLERGQMPLRTMSPAPMMPMRSL